MSHESIIQDNQSQSFGGDPSLSAIASETVELGMAWANSYAKLGAEVLSANLDFWGGGLKPFAEASRFLQAEIAQPSLDRMPKQAIWEDERSILYRYETPKTLEPGYEPQDLPVVAAFALMNSGDILGRTLVPELLKRGFDVYRPEWKIPQRGDINSGLEDYFLDTLPAALEQVKLAASSKEVSLLGWCQGGYGSTILTALQGQLAERAGLTQGDLGIRNLIQLTTPLSVSQAAKTCGGFAEMASDPSFDPEAIVKANGGIYPGALIDHAARGLKSYENNIGTHFNLLRLVQDGNEAKIKRWEEMNGWTKDIKNMPGQFYLDLIKNLYRENTLAEGTMVLRGMPVDLANLATVSVLTLIAELDHIVPPDQTEDALHLFGDGDHTVLRKPGGHISVVSPATCAEMAQWLIPRSKHQRQELAA